MNTKAPAGKVQSILRSAGIAAAVGTLDDRTTIMLSPKRAESAFSALRTAGYQVEQLEASGEVVAGAIVTRSL